MTEEFISITQPVFKVDGRIRAELARDIQHLEVAENTAGLKTLQARFVAIGPQEGSEDETLLYLDGAIFDFGKPIDVAIGPLENARTIFSGFISGIEVCWEEENEPEVVIFAEDKLMKLRMTRRSRTYEEMSDAEIAETIAQEHQISAEVDAPGPTYHVVQQWNMSDLAFLRERARLIRAEIWIENDTLHFKGRPQRNGTELTLVVGNQLLSLSARADLAHQRTSVRVSGYDAQERSVIDEQAGGEAIQGEISGGRTGPEILETAFGNRVSCRVNEVPLTSGEAAEFARAEMLRRARAFVEVCGVTSGSPDMMVGSRLKIERAGTPFNGEGYYVTQMRHTYDLQSGHRTHFNAERATIEVAG